MLLPHLALVLALVLAPSCAALSSLAPGVATVSSAPTVDQVQSTRNMAIRIADETTFALGMVEQASQAGDAAERAGLFPAAALRRLAEAGRAFAIGAKAALEELKAVASFPALWNTARRVLGLMDPFLHELESSSIDGLRQLGAALRIGSVVVRSFVTGG
jgi:hypothetical protein